MKTEQTHEERTKEITKSSIKLSPFPEVRFANTVKGDAFLYKLKLQMYDERHLAKHLVLVLLLVTQFRAFVMPKSDFVSSFFVARTGLITIMVL